MPTTHAYNASQQAPALLRSAFIQVWDLIAAQYGIEAEVARHLLSSQPARPTGNRLVTHGRAVRSAQDLVGGLLVDGPLALLSDTIGYDPRRMFLAMYQGEESKVSRKIEDPNAELGRVIGASGVRRKWGVHL